MDFIYATANTFHYKPTKRKRDITLQQGAHKIKEVDQKYIQNTL